MLGKHFKPPVISKAVNQINIAKLYLMKGSIHFQTLQVRDGCKYMLHQNLLHVYSTLFSSLFLFIANMHK